MDIAKNDYSIYFCAANANAITKNLGLIGPRALFIQRKSKNFPNTVRYVNIANVGN